MQNEGCDIAEEAERYKHEIAELKGRCEEGLKALPGSQADFFDDLVILRHVLSNEGKVEKALETMTQAIAWLQEPASQQLRDHVLAETPPETHDRIISMTQSHLWDEGPTVNGAPVWIIRAGYSQPSRMMDEITAEELLEWLLYWRLVAMQRLDRLTKEGGKLVKMIIINDLRGAGLFQSREKRFFKVLGKSAEMMTFLCPQQQMRAVMMNPPPFMSVMFRFLRPIMPRKALAKVAVCRADTFESPIASCPFSSVWWPAANVPDFLGGEYKVSEGHPLYVSHAVSVQGAATDVTLLPKETRMFELQLPPGEVKAQFQLTCLPHKMAMNPGVEVSARYAPLAEEDVKVTGALDEDVSAAAAEAASAIMEGKEVMAMEVVKVDAGRKIWEWPLAGPGVLCVQVRNPSGGVPGTKKPIRYALQVA